MISDFCSSDILNLRVESLFLCDVEFLVLFLSSG